MANYSSILPVSRLIESLSTEEKPATFDDLRAELQTKTEAGANKYSVNMKENDSLAILYAEESTEDSSAEVVELENSLRTCVFDKAKNQPIACQFGKILYNTDAKEYLKDKEWDNVVVQKCYEGTVLLVFNHDDTWYVTTRRCLDAGQSRWIKDMSYREMFEDAIKDKFTMDDLDKDLCYYFVLLHYRNKNIVTYSDMGRNYKEVVHMSTTKKYTLEEVDITISDKVKKAEDIKMDSLEKLLTKLEEVDEKDRTNKRITLEGYVLKLYSNKEHTGLYQTLKLQTDIYQKLMLLKPNNSNPHQAYLELYQKDQLPEYLRYVANYSLDTIKRINTAMKSVTDELLTIYYVTRKRENPNLYNALPNSYRKTLYGIHKIYMERRKTDFEAKKEKSKEEDAVELDTLDDQRPSRSIKVHDVYHYLKKLPPHELRKIFMDRMTLASNEDCKPFLRTDCVQTMALSNLMFKGIKIGVPQKRTLGDVKKQAESAPASK